MSFDKEKTEEVLMKLLHNVAIMVDSQKIINNICKEIHNPFNFVLGLDHVIASSYTRSFSSSLGSRIQMAAVDIAKIHGWKVLNDGKSNDVLQIKGHYSDETRKVINEIMTYINSTNSKSKITSKQLLDFKSKILDNVLSTVGIERIANADLVLEKTDHKGIRQIAIIELKSGGDLDKGKAKSQREETFELYALLISKYKDEIRQGKVNVGVYFGTIYNKTDLFSGSEKWVSSSVTKNFLQEELLIGKDFWSFICDDKNAYIEIIKIYTQHSYIIQEGILNLKEKVKPILLKKIQDAEKDVQSLYIQSLIN